jgi:hypothetical protein
MQSFGLAMERDCRGKKQVRCKLEQHGKDMTTLVVTPSGTESTYPHQLDWVPIYLLVICPLSETLIIEYT